MRILIDTANTKQIKEMYDAGVICGATTNPTLIAKEGREFEETLQEIIRIFSDDPDTLIFAEAVSLESDKIIAEARELAAKSPNIVVKIPMCREGIKAVHALSKEGIRTAVTLVFTPIQALLAANAGAAFVAPFVGRLDDICAEGVGVVREICEIFRIQNCKTEVLCASLKQPYHVEQVAKAGAGYATIPYGPLKMSFEHPLSAQGIEMFMADWDKLQKEIAAK